MTEMKETPDSGKQPEAPFPPGNSAEGAGSPERPAGQIWHRPYTVEEIHTLFDGPDHLGKLIGIEFTEIGPDYLKGKMPVDGRTRQPMGILHGGASVVLAETLGSIASGLCIDRSRYSCVGLEVNANHLKAVSKGWITGNCRAVRIGRTIHVWEIKMHTAEGIMNCISRLTVAVIPLKR